VLGKQIGNIRLFCRFFSLFSFLNRNERSELTRNAIFCRDINNIYFSKRHSTKKEHGEIEKKNREENERFIHIKENVALVFSLFSFSKERNALICYSILVYQMSFLNFKKIIQKEEKKRKGNKKIEWGEVEGKKPKKDR
jgi:hypothetical protein